MNPYEYIHSDASALPGQPVIKATRLSVQCLPGPMAEGWTGQQVLENYPQLCPETPQVIVTFDPDDADEPLPDRHGQRHPRTGHDRRIPPSIRPSGASGCGRSAAMITQAAPWGVRGRRHRGPGVPRAGCPRVRRRRGLPPTRSPLALSGRTTPERGIGRAAVAHPPDRGRTRTPGPGLQPGCQWIRAR